MATTLELSGYQLHTQVMAQRYRKGRTTWVYLISLPLQLVTTHLPIPDPDKPFEGNRRVSRRHAQKFATYWRTNEDEWATPPLLLDTLIDLQSGFEAKLEVSGVEFGILNLPHNTAAALDILDGQHRILGWKYATDDLARELRGKRASLQQAIDDGDIQGQANRRAEIAELEQSEGRLSREFITLEILQGISPERHKQIFSDIANNAQGIGKSITTSFDQRQILNRVTMDLATSHELLAGRVDLERDRVAGQNENLISAKNLSDIVRSVAIGVDGRVTTRREGELRDADLYNLTDSFLSAMVDSFPDLDRIHQDDLTPAELRDTSLLGSSTIWRVLAGVYRNLAVDCADERNLRLRSSGDQRARALFAKLAPELGFPISSRWMETGVFADEGARAPGSRNQQLKSLTADITSWADELLTSPSQLS